MTGTYTYVLYAASAAAYGYNTRREIARADNRAELELRAAELREADDAAFKYTTVYYVERER